MINNSTTSSVTDEVIKDDFPYRVYWPSFCYPIKVPIKTKYRFPIQKEPKELTRFDLLDIRDEKSEKSYLTIEKIRKYFKKLKKEVENAGSGWKDFKKEIQPVRLSEEDILKMIDIETVKAFEEALSCYIERTQITNRFEVVDW